MSRWCAAWVILVALAFVAPRAARGANPEGANQRALKLAYEGDDLYARSRWAEAYERFAAADALAHSPVFVLYMARCRKNAAHLLEADAIYARLEREPIGPDAPHPFREAVQSASAERAEVQRRIPHARVVVSGAARAAVRVDGKEVEDASRVALDPGAHTFEASAEGRTDRRDVVLIDGGGDVPVTLSLAPRPLPATDESARPSAVPAVVALSVGVAGVAAGAVTGAMAMSKANAIRPNCIDGHCLKSDQSTLDAARAFATASTIGFVVGGAGLAAAGVLFVLRARRGPAVTASVGPASLSLGASF